MLAASYLAGRCIVFPSSANIENILMSSGQRDALHEPIQVLFATLLRVFGDGSSPHLKASDTYAHVPRAGSHLTSTISGSGVGTEENVLPWCIGKCEVGFCQHAKADEPSRHWSHICTTLKRSTPIPLSLPTPAANVCTVLHKPGYDTATMENCGVRVEDSYR